MNCAFDLLDRDYFSTEDITKDDVRQWLRDNDRDREDLEKKDDEALRKEVTRYEVFQQRTYRALCRALEAALEATPELKDIYELLKTFRFDMEKDQQVRAMLKIDSAVTSADLAAELLDRDEYKITDEDIEEYRKEHPKHVAWFQAMSSGELHDLVAYRRFAQVKEFVNSIKVLPVLSFMNSEKEEYERIRKRNRNSIEPMRSKNIHRQMTNGDSK